MQAKPWFQSKTVWGAIVAILASGCNLLGIDLTGIDLGPQTVDRILATVSLIGGLIAFFGRVYAWGQIYFRKTPPVTNATALLLIGALLLASCAEGPVHTGSPVAHVATDVQIAAQKALQAYADYKAGNVDLTWAFSHASYAYTDLLRSSADVKQLVTAWTGKGGDSQKLADRLARIFAESSAPPAEKTIAIAVAAQTVATEASR